MSVLENCQLGGLILAPVIPVQVVLVHLRSCELGEAVRGEEAYVCPWPVVVGV